MLSALCLRNVISKPVQINKQIFDCLARKEEIVGYKLLSKSERQDQRIKKSFC